MTVDLKQVEINAFVMASNVELEKRIKSLEKEVENLKAFLKYQMRSKKKIILISQMFLKSFRVIHLIL